MNRPRIEDLQEQARRAAEDRRRQKQNKKKMFDIRPINLARIWN